MVDVGDGGGEGDLSATEMREDDILLSGCEKPARVIHATYHTRIT